jgi:hypothetical protein
MAAVLRGIVVREPVTRIPLYDDLGTPRRHAAFTEEEIAFWAPLLSLALRTATPEELVTFYTSTGLSGARRDVTSGGLFIAGEELHILLSNLRSSAQYAADIGTADTEDDRLTPMKPIAPQVGKLEFSPESSARDASPVGIGRIFHKDRRELIVLYQTLQPDSSAHPSHPAPPSASVQDRPR